MPHICTHTRTYSYLNKFCEIRHSSRVATYEKGARNQLIDGDVKLTHIGMRNPLDSRYNKHNEEAHTHTHESVISIKKNK